MQEVGRRALTKYAKAGKTGKDHKLVSGHADIVAVQYQAGAVALVWLDLSTGAVMTSHVGLRATLCRGVRDWAGQAVYPKEGLQFLCAVYDYYFLKRYSVQWISGSSLNDIQHTYRV